MFKKVIRKALIIIFLIAVFLSFVFYGWIRTNGKEMVEEVLTLAFKQPVQVGKITAIFPWGMRIDNFDVNRTFKAQEISLWFGIPDFRHKALRLARVELLKPVVYLHRVESGQIGLGMAPPVEASTANPKAINSTVSAPNSGVPAKKKTGWHRIRVDKFEITDGQIFFEDNLGKQDFKLRVEKFSSNASVVSYPLLATNSPFNFKALIFSDQIPFSGSKVEGHGRVNFLKKDMDAQAMIVQSKSGLEISAILNSVNNDVTVKGHLKAAAPAAKLGNPEASATSLKDFALGLVQVAGLQAGVDFAFKTKMDNFRVDNVSLSGSIGYGGVTENSGEVTKKDMKDFSKQMKAFGKQFLGDIKQPKEKLAQ